jgi:serine/threonine protein kinase
MLSYLLPDNFYHSLIVHQLPELVRNLVCSWRYKDMESSDAYIGTQFGNYRLTAKIACGSFGCIYQAQHSFLPRYAAVKLLHTARLHSQRAHEMFLQEAQLLERLKHPHILPIYEFGIDSGLPYLVVEFASGGSLRDLLRQWSPQPLPLEEAIFIISQVGDALHYAHQQGIIHHDLKPENILFNSSGDALLADFGIAIVRDTATLEHVTEVNGTPTYMAPEQFRGKVSRRSDQYALGCIAYELVTGRLPFTAPDAISMGLKHMQESPIRPRLLNSSVPSQIEHVILKALEKRRINRYPDVITLIEELQKTKEQYLNEGNELYSLARYREALAAYEQALHLDSHFVNAYLGKGNALYALSRYEEALIAFEQAIHLDPKNAALHNNKGSVLYWLGRYREALAAYEQALRLDPRLENARHGRDLVLRLLGRSR